jgi:hypothetical protein
MNAAVTTELTDDRTLDRRRDHRGRLRAAGAGLQPRDGRADRRGRLRIVRGDGSRRPSRDERVRRRGASGRSRSAPSSSSASTSSSTSTATISRAPHRRARQGALRRARRGAARDRGHRVRLRHPGAAEGRILGAGLDGHRRLLDPPAARRRGRHHAVQLPAMVPMWMWAPAIACGNTFILKPSEKDPSASSHRASS